MHTKINWDIPMLTLRIFKRHPKMNNIVRYHISTPSLLLPKTNGVYNFSTSEDTSPTPSDPTVISMDLKNYGIDINGINLSEIEAITSSTHLILVTLEYNGLIIECLCHQLYTSYYDTKHMSGTRETIIRLDKIYCYDGSSIQEIKVFDVIRGVAEKTECYRLCERLFSIEMNRLNCWNHIVSIEAYGVVTVNGYKKAKNPMKSDKETSWPWEERFYKTYGSTGLFSPFDKLGPKGMTCEGTNYGNVTAIIKNPLPYEFKITVSISSRSRYISFECHHTTSSEPYFVKGEGIYQEYEATIERWWSTIRFPSIFDLIHYSERISKFGYKIPFPINIKNFEESTFFKGTYLKEGQIIIDKPITQICEELDIVFDYDRQTYKS